MNKPSVTIITATTGTKYLQQNIDSVRKQTYKNVDHLVVIDGYQYKHKLSYMDIPAAVNKVFLPYNTGHDQYNGHRIYGAGTFLAKGDYIIYLDEDNWLEPTHVESLVNTIGGKQWAYSLRKITNMAGEFVCNDDCESLGPQHVSVINDYLVDVNCFFIEKKLAVSLCSYWYRRARNPNEQPEVDRMLTQVLMENFIVGAPTNQYTVNYRAGNRADSVQPEFFLKGNEYMKQRLNGDLPWKK